MKKEVTDGSKQTEGCKEEDENSVAQVSQLESNAPLFSRITRFFGLHGCLVPIQLQCVVSYQT